jgi:CheY-like chemotaxis protein
VQELPLVLVIEDDPDIQVVVEDALTEGGFEPAIAASGEEGVTLLKSGLIKYRAPVTDVILRGRMDGWEVARVQDIAINRVTDERAENNWSLCVLSAGAADANTAARAALHVQSVCAETMI